MVKQAVIILALIATVALPFALRPARTAAARTDETLVVITPHNEAIRQEFAAGFRKWYEARTGRTITIDWRVIGGTSEIARFLEGEYVASFQNYWTNQLRRPWSSEVLTGFHNPRLAPNASQEAREAREAFLASNVSSGIDLFFGGGTYDFVRQAQAGRIVDSGIVRRFPEWFKDDVIPRQFAGEEYWDQDGRWIGTVLSSYGIIFNRDSLERLGVESVPHEWDDLKDPRLAGEVALADPTKSGSIAKAFENVIQQQMQRRLVALQAAGGADPKAIEARAVSEGWREGLALMQLIGANGRYFTDTSQKPPIDVAAGNCAVGMCIDFYGRQQEEAIRRRGNGDHIGYATPMGGSVSSVDPIALMRGAPNREAAVAFIEFVMSIEGQKLWNFRPETPGGPEHYALRRLPVRRDFYREEFKAHRSDPDAEPYNEQEQLVYRAAWTSAIFREMSFVIRVMCLDTHVELARAWRAINAAPESRRAAALAVLQNLDAVSYEQVNGAIKQALNARDKSEEIRLARDLGNRFRQQYAEAERLARGDAN
ncbi:MAG TPA: extracellular solute-binding protein [Opitutaceae bacterium]